MSTLSSANITDVNLVLKERTHMRLCLNMLIFTHNLGNWLMALNLQQDCLQLHLFPVVWQRWRSHHSICHSQKTHDASKLHSSVFYRTGVIADKTFTLQELGISHFFVALTLTLTDNPQCKCDPHSLKISLQTRSELSTSRLTKAAVLYTYTYTETPPKHYQATSAGCNNTTQMNVVLTHWLQILAVFLSILALMSRDNVMKASSTLMLDFALVSKNLTLCSAASFMSNTHAQAQSHYYYYYPNHFVIPFVILDVLWQIVPDTRGSNRKSPVTNGWKPGSADNQRWWRRGAKTATSFNISRSTDPKD